ncbi:MAG: transglutaminase domain-containing protein, partial [Thiohalocapsa sp.]
RRAYRMTSAVRYRTAGLSAAEQAAATALPANITPRMRALAERWRAGAADPRDVVRRALAHFNEAPFRYTLLPPDLGDNPMDAFLFDARSGFCEHYASSFALLMRIADIPTRIVLGYLGGDYNPLSGDYVVRQSDAHAWNEVWLDDLGWVRVDPTAAVDPARVDTSARLSALGADAPSRFRVDDRSWAGRLAYGVHLLADALDAGWREWVVGFSYDRQQRLLDALGMPQLRAPGLALVMIASAATVVALLTLALSREPLSREPVTRCYQRFLRRLERIGLGRRCDEGPVEHRDRILAGRPDLQPAVDAVVIPYLRLRFGLTALPGDRQRLKRGVAAFRPRRHPPRRDSGAREPT